MPVSCHELTVDRIKPRTRVLGPGVRTAIWFHGCSRGCPGCIAQGMNMAQDYRSYPSEELFEQVKAVRGIEGITLSGGEPFDQNVAAMGEFLASVRAYTELGIMAYTGYRLEEIVRDESRRGLLDRIDILVDGPYVEDLDDGQLLRGSGNQRFHFLTDRYKALEGVLEAQRGRKIEVDFVKGMEFSFAGIPPRGFKDRLGRELGLRGMQVNW